MLFLEDHYLNLNMTVLQQTKTEVIFPKNSYPAGIFLSRRYIPIPQVVFSWISTPQMVNRDSHYDERNWFSATSYNLAFPASLQTMNSFRSSKLNIKGLHHQVTVIEELIILSLWQ